MIDYKKIFVSSDQPVICPICGARTEIILDLSHTQKQTTIHECLADNCSLRFVVETDDYFIDK